MSNIFIISGPTGSGESTITQEIINIIPNSTRLVTATSREPRGKEKNKIDYYFFSKKEFEEKIKNGNILEYTYIKNRDVYYGSYKSDLEDKLGKKMSIIVNTDYVGTKFYKREYDAVAIFIHPGDIKDLRGRLKKRNPKISEDELGQRIENAEKEIRDEMKYYDHIVYNKNGKLGEAVEKVADIINQNR
jgi:guanylate kinase